MQKIIIKNFGPVKDAEIEIKKVLVLIGEQASGKSTIAKLIYFFKGLPNYLLYHFRRYISNNLEKINTDIEQEIIAFIKNKFLTFWASSHSDNFNITYYYDFENNRYLEVSSRDDDIYVNFSHNFIDRELILQLEIVRKSYLRYVEEERQNPDGDHFFNREKYKSDFLFFDQQLYRQFNKQYYDQLFMVAGRNITVNYSSLFEKELSPTLKSMKDLFSINELIMTEFIEKVSNLQRIFRGLRGFRGIVKYNISTSGADDRKIGKAKMLANLCDRIFLIFKGGYFIDNNGEAIITKDGKKVDLSESSSGQQEVIRILQDIFIIIHLNQKVLRVIEEPEAHLFPVAQKQLVELLALMVNYQPENQLIITTHSPYILTVFNHLLFASRVVAKNPAAEEEVKEIVDKDYWLDPNEFSAYSLGNESFPEDNAKYCESIFDTEMGMLQQNYLDTVSEILGWEFNTLYRIYTKSHRRK